MTRGSLPRLAPGQSLGLALGIASACNLRDIGGYRTAEGTTVAFGLAYRSDRLHGLTADDHRKLDRVGLRHCFDLRTAAEIAARPNQIPSEIEQVHLNVLADSRSAVPAQLEALLRNPKEANAELDTATIDALYLAGYRQFVALPSALQSFRTLFAALADPGKLPAVFHCTTGKDRTGWAAAALLTLLGVPKETVIADFLRSNDYIVPHYRSAVDAYVAGGGNPAIPLAIFGVKREYLEASFEEMRSRFGSIDGYFSAGLGIDEGGQRALRVRFLAPA
jgi:protein-tyrosine phosphatase